MEIYFKDKAPVMVLFCSLERVFDLNWGNLLLNFSSNYQ